MQADGFLELVQYLAPVLAEDEARCGTLDGMKRLAWKEWRYGEVAKQARDTA